MTTLIFGATGLCGTAFVKHADEIDALTKLVTITRRKLNYESTKLENIVEVDTAKYGSLISEIKPKTLYTSLATTRAAAGSAQAFVDIDYGINIEIAKAAKGAGVETFVLVSSMGASALSPFLYMKTKGRLEDDVIALKFPRTIILRPGPLLGEREKSKGFLNTASEYAFKPFHRFGFGRSVFGAIYGDEVGKGAAKLAAQPFTASGEPKVEFVYAKELYALAHE